MHGIHSSCLEYGKEKDGFVDYVRGANLAGFKKSGRRHAGLRRRLICDTGRANSPACFSNGPIQFPTRTQ